MIDVRQLLQSRVRDGRLELQVSHESMAGDPFVGQPKRFILPMSGREENTMWLFQRVSRFQFRRYDRGESRPVGKGATRRV